jgi:hypothetical protein
MKRLIWFFFTGLVSCTTNPPPLETSDLNTICDVDEDCRIHLEIPCSRCAACIGVPINVDAEEDYQDRLSEAEFLCPGEPTGLCDPCQESKAKQAVACVDGTCTAVPCETPTCE